MCTVLNVLLWGTCTHIYTTRRRRIYESPWPLCDVVYCLIVYANTPVIQWHGFYHFAPLWRRHVTKLADMKRGAPRVHHDHRCRCKPTFKIKDLNMQKGRRMHKTQGRIRGGEGGGGGGGVGGLQPPALSYKVPPPLPLSSPPPLAFRIGPEADSTSLPPPPPPPPPAFRITGLNLPFWKILYPPIMRHNDTKWMYRRITLSVNFR